MTRSPGRGRREGVVFRERAVYQGRDRDPAFACEGCESARGRAVECEAGHIYLYRLVRYVTWCQFRYPVRARPWGRRRSVPVSRLGSVVGLVILAIIYTVGVAEQCSWQLGWCRLPSRESFMRTLVIALVCVACSSGAVHRKGDGEIEKSPSAIPASSGCGEFDPAGLWTLRSDHHPAQDFHLHRDNTIALRNGVFRWMWEDDRTTGTLTGCFVRFEADFYRDDCEFAVVEDRGAVSGFASCCEPGDPGEEIERPVCNEFEVSGVVRLTHL